MIHNVRRAGFFAAILFLGGCAAHSEAGPMPDDFHFKLEYGVQGKQQVDTFSNTVVKDLVMDGTAEATVSLTNEEMEFIYGKMTEIGVMGKLRLKERQQCSVSPSSSSKWTIQMNGETRTISYGDYCDPPRDAEKLLELEAEIHKIVSDKAAYQALPDANGGYD